MSTAENETIEAAPVTNRKQPFPRGFLDTISTGWAERPESIPSARPQAAYAAARRAKVSEAFPGKRLVIEAGSLKQRSNDTDYVFRAHSAFAHLTGWAADTEPDSVLVFEPTDAGHDVTLYFRERADRTTTEFYADATVGEFWIGPRPHWPASPPIWMSRPTTSRLSKRVQTMSRSAMQILIASSPSCVS